MRNNPFIIGLVGLPGAGRTTVTEFLEKHGFVRVILSDIIRDELLKRGITECTREILQNVGNEMRRKFGPDVLAKRAMKRLKTLGKKKFVIDGIRNNSEIIYLRKQKNFLLLGITAASRVRFTRLKKRKVNPLKKSYKEFLLQEERENALGTATTGLRVIDCLNQCQIRLKNTTTKQALEKQLQEFFRKNGIV